MDELIGYLQNHSSINAGHSFTDLLICFLLTIVLTLPLAFVFTKTQKRYEHDSGFVNTLFILAFTTAAIMMIIGSDIARAFSLVGALSIIRFRTAVKDTQNTGYIFATIVIGMGCGTQLFSVAISFSLFMTILLIALNYFSPGVSRNQDQLLNLEVDENRYNVVDLEAIMRQEVSSFSLLLSELVNDSGVRKLSYVITTKNFEKLSKQLSNLEGVTKVSTYFNDQRINF